MDGVIITHGHADACYGMDDLRGWTLGGIIQKSINVYLAPETMEVVARTFPFLVDSSMATGKWSNDMRKVGGRALTRQTRWWRSGRF